MGEVYAKLFSLPSCFILTMVTPLYLTHLNHLISCNSSQGVQNLDRVLSIKTGHITRYPLPEPEKPGPGTELPEFTVPEV